MFDFIKNKPRRNFTWFKKNTDSKDFRIDSQAAFFNQELLRLTEKDEKLRTLFFAFLQTNIDDIQKLFLPAIIFRYEILKSPPDGIDFFRPENYSWFSEIDNWKDLIDSRMIPGLQKYLKNPRPVQTVIPLRYGMMQLAANLNSGKNFPSGLSVLDVGGGAKEMGVLHSNFFFPNFATSAFYYPEIKNLTKEKIFAPISKSITLDSNSDYDFYWHLAGIFFSFIGNHIQFYAKNSANPPKDFSPKKSNIKSETWNENYARLSEGAIAKLKNFGINSIFASATLYQLSKKEQMDFKKIALQILSDGDLMTVFCSMSFEITKKFNKNFISNKKKLKTLKKLVSPQNGQVVFCLKKEGYDFVLLPIFLISRIDPTYLNYKTEIIKAF